MPVLIPLAGVILVTVGGVGGVPVGVGVGMVETDLHSTMLSM
jgi:hypothetical protein